MKHYFQPIFALATFALLSSLSVQADTQEKMVIALKTGDFELAETDISALAIGEAQTIETESGKIIDILRTADGAEIYVDGELLEMDLDHEGLHEDHMIKRHVEIICDNDEDCDENIVILAGADDDNEISEWVTADGENVFIHKEVEITCSDDEEEGTRCSDQMIWISDGEDIDIEKLHEAHESNKEHKIIVIKKVHTTED